MLNYLLLVLYVGVVLSDVEKRPNFVVILTDDQDVVLSGMTPMKNVHQFIAKEGVTFTNSYVTSPICCPSRASLLTGLYIHNHHTHNNSLHGNCYGQEWRENEHRVFVNALQDSGYNTFYAGKYMNQYGVKEAGGPEVVPRGWSEWHGLVGNSVYYNYTMSNNGVPTHSTDLYLTDVIRDLSISYIENQTESRPFLMVLSPPAPHQPFTPARRHEGAYSNVTAVRHPNFNVAVHDKHWLLRMPPSPLPESMMPELDRVYRSRWEALLAVDEMVADVIGALEVNALLDNTYVIYTSDNGYHIALLDRVYRSRWEALLAVDEMVADVIGALEVNALLDNTYVIYTSDNGYHIGQFSQVYDKRQPYEADIKVPLVIRGPGLKKNAQNPQPVLNIDIAPTILHLAGVKAPEMDGRPVKMEKEEVDERYMLVEYYGEGRDGSVDRNCPWKYDSDNLAQCYPEYDCKCQDAKNNTFACLRHIAKRLNMKYCIFADSEKFAELYDLAADPYELENSVDDEFQAIIVWYNNYLSQMLKCKGAKNCDDPLGESVQ